MPRVPMDFKDVVRSMREEEMAGSAPKSMQVVSTSPMTKSRTQALSEACCKRGMSPGSSRSRRRRKIQASAMPAAPAMELSSKDSVSN